MNMLMERLGEMYFATRKQVKARNKIVVNISSKATAFFKVFLEKKMAFKAPTGIAHVRPYSIKENRHFDWPASVWSPDIASTVLLGIIDFKLIPGVLTKETSTIDHLFFYEALMTMQAKKQPLLEDIKSWLFIVTNETNQSQVLTFVEKNEGLSSYNQSLLTTTQQKLNGFTTCQPIPLKPTRKFGSFFSRARRTHSRPELNRNFNL